MNRAIAIAATLCATPVCAQPIIVDACARAAEVYFGISVTVEGATVSSAKGRHTVQANLKPTRLDVDAAIDLLGTTRCEFTQAMRPLGLLSFCPPDGCILVSGSRLESIRVLLEREGY